MLSLLSLLSLPLLLLLLRKVKVLVLVWRHLSLLTRLSLLRCPRHPASLPTTLPCL